MANKRMLVLCVCAVVAMSLMATEVQSACSLNDMASCLGSVSGTADPTPACCAKVATVDVPCFCNLVKTSNFPPASVAKAVQVPQKCGGAAYTHFKGVNCAGHIIN